MDGGDENERSVSLFKTSAVRVGVDVDILPTSCHQNQIGRAIPSPLHTLTSLPAPPWMLQTSFRAVSEECEGGSASDSVQVSCLFCVGDGIGIVEIRSSSIHSGAAKQSAHTYTHRLKTDRPVELEAEERVDEVVRPRQGGQLVLVPQRLHVIHCGCRCVSHWSKTPAPKKAREPPPDYRHWPHTSLSPNQSTHTHLRKRAEECAHELLRVLLHELAAGLLRELGEVLPEEHEELHGRHRLGGAVFFFV